MANVKTHYRGHVIECDDEFGYFIQKNGREIGDGEGLPTIGDAKQIVDEIIRDTAEYRRGH